MADVPATPVVGDPYNYSSNDPLNRADPLGLKDGKGRSGDDGFTAFLATLEIGSLGDLANAAGDVLHGIFDGAWDMIAGAGTLLRLSDCISGPLGFLDNALSDFCENSINALHGMAKAAVKNPLGFLKTLGKGIVDWDECAKEGGYWCVGHFVPLIVVCVLTDCVSSTIDAVQGGYDALKALLATSGKFDAESAITAAKAAEAGVGGAGPVRVGQAGEVAVQGAYDIGPKATVEIGGRTRILDGLTDSTVTEVKNVASQSYTQQLKDSLAYAQSTGRAFDLYVRPDTYLTGPLRDAIAQGLINLKFIP